MLVKEVKDVVEVVGPDGWAGDVERACRALWLEKDRRHTTFQYPP